MTDKDYIQRAMNLALRAKGETSPNPLVGAVIVKGGRTLAEGWHKRCGGDHAEIMALKKAGRAAAGATMYITLEPCFHFGRTPPCVDAVIAGGIKRVVIGMNDPNPLTRGRSIVKLRKAGVKVTVGILENESRRMNEVFVKYIIKNMPFVVAKCAQTLDGKIATVTGDSKWITAEGTRAFARKLRNEFDAILVGVNTVLLDDPALNAEKKSKRIKKIILDSNLKTPLNAQLFRGTRAEDCIIATTAKADRRKLKAFLKRGVEMVVCPAKDGRVDLKWLLKELTKQEIASVLIEGGSEVIGNALKENLIDKMHIYIAPKLLGDQTAVSSVSGLNIRRVADALTLNDLTIQKINQDIFIEGYVHRNR